MKIEDLENPLIATRNEYSECEIDILVSLLKKLSIKNLPGEVYRFYFDDLEQSEGHKWSLFKLQQATFDLSGRVFDIKNINSIYQLVLFQFVEHKENERYFEVVLSAKALPYLIELKTNFLINDLRSILKCTSKHAKRLFVMCVQWLASGERTIEMKINTLKEQLNLYTSESGKEQFAILSGFKKGILDRSKKQISENTNIEFDYKLIKRGRSFDRIVIQLSYKS